MNEKLEEEKKEEDKESAKYMGNNYWNNASSIED